MTIQEIQEEIIEEHSEFTDKSNKYIYLVKLGKECQPIDAQYKTDDNLIIGCQVETWFHSIFKDGKMFYHIDSSSIMIRGIIALLTKILSGQAPEDIIKADLYFIKRLGLEDDFSPVRANSLWKLINRMRAEATVCLNKN